MSRMLFVNLPVHDLARTVAYFGALGFEFDRRFSDDNAVCMVINEQACVMLLVEEFFASFTTKDVADPAAGTGACGRLSLRSRVQLHAPGRPIRHASLRP